MIVRRVLRGLPVRGAIAAVLGAADSVVQTFVPPEEDLVCYASMPDFTDNAYYQFRYLVRERSALRHLWLVRDPSVGDEIERVFNDLGGPARGHRLEVYPWSRATAYFRFIRARVVFHTHGAFSFSSPRRGRITVSLWHGMPIKAIRHLHEPDVAAGMHPVVGTYHLASSVFFREVIADAFAVDPERVLTCGLPRCDVLKRWSSPLMSRDEMLGRLGLDPSRPVVVWLPTHRRDAGSVHQGPTSSFADDVADGVLDALDRYARDPAGGSVLVKLHQFDADPPAALESREGIVTVTSEQWSRVGVQLYDLLSVADGLLSDISSVMVDYLHTSRPIGIVGIGPSIRASVVDADLLRRCGNVSTIDSARAVTTFLDACGAAADPTDQRPLNEDAGTWSAHELASRFALGPQA